MVYLYHQMKGALTMKKVSMTDAIHAFLRGEFVCAKNGTGICIARAAAARWTQDAAKQRLHLFQKQAESDGLYLIAD